MYDTDFLDNDTWDQSNFDQPGTAISFFSGHGRLVPYGENPPHRCGHSTECTSPPQGNGARGICKAAGLPGHAQGDTSQCVYNNERELVVHGSQNQFGNLANYSGGRTKWGESKNAGDWAGASTDGGTNLVVLDASGCATQVKTPEPPSGVIAVPEGGASGYQHGADRSRFSVGAGSYRATEHGYFKLTGAEGTLALDQFNGSVYAVEGVFGDGRAPAVCRQVAQRRTDDGGVPGVRHLPQDRLQDRRRQHGAGLKLLSLLF